MYVLRAKVRLTDASNDLIRIGIAGPDTALLIKDVTGLPCHFDHPLQVTHDGVQNTLCLSPQRIELITSVENAAVLWQRLDQHAKPVGADCWNWLNIESGIPVILPETQEMFLPQMVNLDAIGGVSFKKAVIRGKKLWHARNTSGNSNGACF